MTLKKFAYLIAFGVLALAAMPTMAMYGSDSSTQTGKSAPNFKGTDVDGNTFELADYKGKIVVLEWTNHQCPYVIKHYDSGNMQKTQKAAIDDGVVWVSIASSAEGKQGYLNAEETKALMAEQGHHATTRILDPSGKIGHLYDAKTTPHMFVIDENGILVYQGAIDSDSSPRQSAIEGAENYVLSALADLKAGNPVSTPESKPYGCAVKYAR